MRRCRFGDARVSVRQCDVTEAVTLKEGKNGERRQRIDGPGEVPGGGVEVCPGGTDWPQQREADTEVGARNGGGTVGKTGNPTESIFFQWNGEERQVV